MTFDYQYIEKSIDYEAYKNLIESLHQQGKSTGPLQTEELLAYTALNIHRMKRVEKTTVLSEELKMQLSKIKEPQIWLVIAEGWCGDAAQSVPAFHLMENVCQQINVRFLFRDENLDLMDLFLTNGKRSIPKLLILDETSLNVLAQWGSQPQEAANLVQDLKDSGIEKTQIKEKLHLWYAKNKCVAMQAELTKILADLHLH